ncbi:hypothetical protein FAGAP_1487 [Fusarium agapanthi]|uniref:F-box domain-containing protein n=1 Tax=Fusarium agapanthi TaxID=1803897 RepID=A0A9P5BHL6_9HYPO|nr:hypothetical protein FAGAP_1487 [Fusarium agapanthi]
MESCHILRLPDELQVAVVELLPGNALKATRATCRKLNGIASPYLYPVLYLSCHQLDLDVFRLVASNPLLIGGVEELAIDDTTLSPRLGNWEVYKTVASHPQNWPDRKKPYDWREEFENEDRIWSTEPDKDFHALYKSVLKGHHTNRRRHADIIALRRALPLFKSLRSLVISNRTADDSDLLDLGAQSEQSSSPVVKMWRRLGVAKQERPPFAPRCDWAIPWHEHDLGARAETMQLDWYHDKLDTLINQYGLPASRGKLYWSLDPDGRYTTGNRMSYQKRHTGSFNWTDLDWLEPGYTSCRTIKRESRAISIALEVLWDPQIHLDEFRVAASLHVDASLDPYNSLHQPGLSILLFSDSHSPLVPKLISFFSSNLTKFHLVLSDCTKRDAAFGSDEGFRILDQGHVTTILKCMTKLEDLLLELHGMPIIYSLPETCFDRLRRVEFSCGEIYPQELLSFLGQHGGTLESLIIRFCCIDPAKGDETWEDTMRETRDMKDAETLLLDDGDVTGVYDHAPCRGCGKNYTLHPKDTGCPIHSWEFIGRSLWRQFDGYPWEFQDVEGSYVGQGFDTESEGGESDKEGGNEGGGSEQEASGI